VDRDADRCTQQRKLLSRCGPPWICRNQKRASPIAKESQCEFRGGCRLPCTLETEEQDARRSLAQVKLST
jgi:hypothetical protein